MGLKSWIASKVVSKTLKKANVKKPYRNQISNTVKSMMNGKQVMKNEPVMLGGAITIAVALGASYGLELTAEELSVTISSIIAVITFIQRKFVSPVKNGKKG